MKQSEIPSVTSRLLPILGTVLAFIFWLTDTMIDVYLFEEGNSFFDSFFSPDPVELWMRLLVVVMMLLFAFYARKLLAVQKKRIFRVDPI